MLAACLAARPARHRGLRRRRRRLEGRRTPADGQDQEEARRRAAGARARCPIPTSWRPCRKPGPQRPALVVGFAAETENLVANAIDKRSRKGCDWIVANDVSPATGTFGGERNTVHLISAAGVRTGRRWPRTRSPCSWPARSPCISPGRRRPRPPSDAGTGARAVEIEIVRLPHGRDLAAARLRHRGRRRRRPAGRHRPGHRAGSAGAAHRADRHLDCPAGGLRGPGPPAFRAGGQERHHRRQRAGHHRCRLSRRNRRDPDQSGQGAVPHHPRHANCTAGRGAACPGGLAGGMRARPDGAGRRRVRIDGRDSGGGATKRRGQEARGCLGSARRRCSRSKRCSTWPSMSASIRCAAATSPSASAFPSAISSRSCSIWCGPAS